MNQNKNHSFTGITKFLLGIFFLGGCFYIFPLVAEAQGVLGDQWDKYLNGVQGFSASNKSGEELAINFVQNLIRIVRNVVGAGALVLGVIYGLSLVMSRGQEEKISKQKTNFLWVFVGFVVLIISENVATIFNPEESTSKALVDFNATRDQMRDVVDYIKWLLGSIIVLLMAVSAVRMVTAGGDEETINSEKKNITWSLIGILVILLANSIVNSIYLLNAPDEAVAAPATTGITEIAGVIRLILVFIGPLAIAFTIYAGFLYLTSLDDEEGSKQAKTMIVAGVVSIVIIYGAYALVNTFTSQNLTHLSSYLI